MDIKKVLWNGAWGLVALVTTIASVKMVSAPQRKLERELKEIKEARFEEIRTSEGLAHKAGYASLAVRSGTNNVTFYDLLNDGRLNGISVDGGEQKGAIFDRNAHLPEYINTINSNLGDAPDRLYKFTWENNQKLMYKR